MQRILRRLCVLMLVLAPCAQAGSLFEVIADNGGAHASGRSASLIDLVKDAISARGAFTAFSDTSGYTITIRYGGDHSLLLVLTNSGGGFTLTTPTGKTFTNPTMDGLAHDVGGKLKRDRSILDFGDSVLSVTDGHPGASTEIMAAQDYELFASPPTLTRDERAALMERRAAAERERGSMDISADYGRIRARSFDGSSYTLPISYRKPLNERATLVFGFPVNYTEIEGAQIYRGGVGVGLPLQVWLPDTNRPWSWQVALSGSAMAGVSDDMAEGSIVAQGALSSALTYDLPFCSLSMGNHFSFYESEPLAGYDAQVSQQITKNGLKVGVPVGRGWVVETWGIHTYFFESAATRNFYTVGGSLAYRRRGKAGGPSRGSVYLSVYADVADNYVTPHARLGARWSF